MSAASARDAGVGDVRIAHSEGGARAGAGGGGDGGLLAGLRRTMSLAVDRLNEERRPRAGEGEAAELVPQTEWRRGMERPARNLALDVLMACWGLGTWLGVNGLFVQLPLLVERLPEQWALPASMALAVQLANVGLLLYAAAKRLRPRAPDAPYIYLLLAVGTVALALNSQLYARTARVAGADRSVAFLALTFFAALVGCTSSVLFYPYLRHFRDVYLTTYLVGEGLSGFVPSLLALIQGAGGRPECAPGADGALHPVFPPPRFGTDAFLLALAGLAALSLASFGAVHGCGAFRGERVAPGAAAKEEEAASPRARLLAPSWLAVLALMLALNALSNGVLPSVQSYSCMPYGTEAYHFAATLGAMANPAACLAGVWLRPLGARALAALLAAAAAPLGYILATALLSPAPPLQHHVGGIVLIVSCWVFVSGAVSYARLWVYAWARAGGARGMRAAGAATQLGSAAGSLLLFALVNYTALFTQPPACPAPA